MEYREIKVVLGSRKVITCARAIYLVRTQTRNGKISYPLIRTRTCAYQGVKNITSLETFAYVLNESFLIMWIIHFRKQSFPKS